MATSIIDSLQSLTQPIKPKATKSSAVATTAAKTSTEQKFLDYAKKSPAEKIRDALLKSVGVTEDDLKTMSPEQRQGIEQKIADQIKQTLDKKNATGGNTSGFFKDISV